ncbi:MAG: hypothetical protein ACREM2_09195 [Vulcanimicrobiaceae bacterium]
MSRRPPRPLVLLLALALVPAFAVAPSAAATPAASSARPGAERDDWSSRPFAAAVSSGLERFYAQDFAAAEADFERALALVPDNSFAISFADASAAQTLGKLDQLADAEEDAVAADPKSYAAHVRLAFAYLFQSELGRERRSDARDEIVAAENLKPRGAAAHDAEGILRFDERSNNRAKIEFLEALASDPGDVLAREYLGTLYQTELHEPRAALSYVIEVPNLVPNYADIYFHIGSILKDLDQPEAAIANLQRGLALDPQHVGEAGLHGYTMIAQIYLGEHQIEKAQAILTRAVADDADPIFAKTLLDRIASGAYGATPSPAKP